MIMKKIWLFAAIAVLVATVSSCLDRTEIQVPTEEDGLTLNLVFGEPETRTTTDGTPRENAVTSVDLFFYTDIESAPAFFYRDPNPSVQNGQYVVKLVAGGKIGNKDIPALDRLFNNKQSHLFAVFNYPAEITSPGTLANLKQNVVSDTFSYDGREQGADDAVWKVTEESDTDPNHPRYFIMTGEKILVREKNQLKDGTVEMLRLAAKVAVTLKIKDRIVSTSFGNWTPHLGKQNVRAYLCNYVQNSVLGSAGEVPVYPQSYTQKDYTPYVVNTDKLTPADGFYTVAPQQEFYTYPISWEAGSDQEPFIKVILPWDPEDRTKTQKELYYKVMFPKNIKKLEANKFYHLTATLSLIGNEGEPVVVFEATSITVKNWAAGGPVNTVISDAKYLSIQSNYTKYFDRANQLGYSSSGKVYLTINEVSQKNLKTGDTEYLVKNGVLQDKTTGTQNRNPRTDLGTPQFIVDDDNHQVGFKLVKNNVSTTWITVSNSPKFVEAGHQLDADLTSIHMDVTPWTYKVTLHLVDGDSSYDKEMTFEQWPNVYVVDDMNSDYLSRNHNQNQGYVYVDNLSQNRAQYGGVAGYTTGEQTNSNQNMYVLTISVSNKYNIGDPRTSDVDLLGLAGNYYGYNYNNWGEGYRLGSTGQDHQLTYYHPCEREGTSNMIAPKIRIASSYGKAGKMSKENAQRRCASYQEDGIPAGRWRLPTFAEVEFIATLSSLGRIPFLFSDESTTNGDYYWVANGSSSTTGAALVDNVGQTAGVDKGVWLYENYSNNSFIRCVYDEWFWGDAKQQRPLSNRTQFTWGDTNY